MGSSLLDDPTEWGLKKVQTQFPGVPLPLNCLLLEEGDGLVPSGPSPGLHSPLPARPSPPGSLDGTRGSSGCIGQRPGAQWPLGGSHNPEPGASRCLLLAPANGWVQSLSFFHDSIGSLHPQLTRQLAGWVSGAPPGEGTEGPLPSVEQTTHIRCLGQG